MGWRYRKKIKNNSWPSGLTGRTGRRDMTNLQRIRKEKGYSQSKLGDRAEINYRTIQAYEQKMKDINKASAETIKKLADALGVRMEDLLE